MKKLMLILLVGLVSPLAKAQWVVSDPLHIAQTILDLGNQVRQFQKVAETVQKVRQIAGAVKTYRKVTEISKLADQTRVLYQNSVRRVQLDRHFTSSDVNAIVQSYQILIKEALALSKDAVNILSRDILSMTDAERLAMLDEVYDRLREHYALVDYLTKKFIAISMSRATTSRDREITKALYGIGVPPVTPKGEPF